LQIRRGREGVLFIFIVDLVRADGGAKVTDFEEGHVVADDEVVGLKVGVDDAFLLEVGEADQELWEGGREGGSGEKR
jgi:hypothetical protein